MKPPRINFILLAVFLYCSEIFIGSSNAIALAPKPPEVAALEMSFRKSNGRIEVDTTLKNIGPKPIHGLTAVYHFFAIDHHPLTTQRTKIDEPVLMPEAEAVIHAQLEEPARVLTAEFSAVDEKGHEFRVRNAGPFNVE